MKTYLLAVASVVLIAPATNAIESEQLAPVATGQVPVVVGQPLVVGESIGAESSAGCIDGSLGEGVCCGCDPCRRRVWVYGEYLNWWTRGDETPPLLTTTTTLNGVTLIETFGGGLNDEYRKGFRVGGGFFPSKSLNLGIEASWFSLGDRNDGTTSTSSATTLLTRPIILLFGEGGPAAFFLGGGEFDGAASINHNSEFEGGNVGIRVRLAGGGFAGDCNSCVRCLDFQVGYQNYHLNESLSIHTIGESRFDAFTTIGAEDFDNDNRYHGGYLGLAGELNCGKWFFGGNVRGGIGSLQHRSIIRGSTTELRNGDISVDEVGPLLARRNIGDRTEDESTWSGELGARIGYQPTCWLRAYVGYDFIYINEVTRPGGTVDNASNFSSILGYLGDPPRPNYDPRREAFWAQGLTAGVELKF